MTEPADGAAPVARDAAGPDRPRFPLDILAAVALGGVVGAAGRHAVAELVPVADDGFPTSTFVVNVVGSFLAGLLVVVSIRRAATSRYLLAFVVTGVLGAFTTFSTFAVETILLVDHDRPTLAAAYVAVTLVAGIAAAWCGVAAGRTLGAGTPGRPDRSPERSPGTDR
jgi:CrcB protein